MKIAIPSSVTDRIDRKTVAFYLTLLGLVVLDIVLIFWIFSPFTDLGVHAYASQIPAVSDAGKPSPFEIADAKRGPVQGFRRKPRLSN